MTVTASESDEIRLPAPRRASEELPDLNAVHGYGIPLDDLDMARAVACLLSWFLGRGRAQSRSHLKAMSTMLAAACAVDVSYDGEVTPAPHPELDGVAWPAASTVFKRLGIDAETLAAYWRSARDQVSDACFPVEWLLAFFPPPLWAGVASLIEWGPEHTRVRLEQTVIMLAQRKTRRERRRRPKGSTLTWGTVDAWLTALLGLIDELIDLRGRVKQSKRPALPRDLLEPWTAAPRRPNLRECGVKRSNQDNRGPAILDVQRRLHELARDYEANPAYPYHRLRSLLLLALCSVLGPRATALRTTRVADFKPDAVGPDGVRRSVLEIRPGKTWDADQIHRLPLPADVAQWTRAWIEISGRQIGDGSPLFPHKKPKPGLALKPLTEVGFYHAIAGGKFNEGHGSKALVPLNGDPFLGHRPHALRHTAEQVLQAAAAKLKAENPGRFDHLTPDDFARAVLGHSLQRTISDTYRDLDRETLSFEVIDTAWQILWGNGSAKRGLDPKAIRDTRQSLDSLRIAIRALDSEQTRQLAQQEQLAKAARELDGDELLRVQVESNALAARIADRQRKLRALEEQLADANAAYERACTEQIPLPHDLDDPEHARLLAEALGQPDQQDDADTDSLAESYSVADLAELFGTTEQTINRWFRQGPPKGRPAPWDNTGWIIEGERTKQLQAQALNHAALTEAQKERAMLIRRRPA